MDWFLHDRDLSHEKELKKPQRLRFVLIRCLHCILSTHKKIFQLTLHNYLFTALSQTYYCF